MNSPGCFVDDKRRGHLGFEHLKVEKVRDVALGVDGSWEWLKTKVIKGGRPKMLGYTPAWILKAPMMMSGISMERGKDLVMKEQREVNQ